MTITQENAEALAKEGSRFVVYRPREMELAEGDTIRITANGKDASGKHRLNNGATYQVDSFDSQGNIRLGNGWVVDASQALHLTHGYVSTSHAAQGRTTDRVLIAQSSQSFPASDKSQFYVSISRGRQQAQIYTDSKADLMAAVNRDRPRLLATELVRRPRRKLRDRIKRHLSFLRRVASMHRQPEPVRKRELEMER